MRKHLYCVIAIMGLSFCFLVGFPFQQHKESYLHVVSIEQQSLMGYAINGLHDCVQKRPLAFALEWLAYKPWGSVYPIQVVNFLLTISSWLLLCSALRQRRLFSVLGLLTGGAFFSGYLYLFHLSGAGYAPLLLLIALMFSMRERLAETRQFALLAVATVVVALFHPFACLLYAGFMLGVFLEDRKLVTRGRVITAAVVAAATAVAASVMNGGAGQEVAWSNVESLIVSLRTVEVHKLLALVSVGLTIWTVITAEVTKRSKGILLLAAIACIGAAVMAKIPLIAAWMLVCVLKSLLARRFSGALLVVGAAALPFFGQTGTPTHMVYAVMICTALTAIDCTAIESKLGWVNGRFALAMGLVLGVLVVCIRLGVQVPVVSRFMQPLMAEREKTYQMANILSWLQRSPYKDRYIAFDRPAMATRKNYKQTIDRRNTAPTSAAYLDYYLAWLRNDSGTPDPNRRLVVTFGNSRLDGAKLAYSVPGRFAGSARVYDTTHRGAPKVSSGVNPCKSRTK